MADLKERIARVNANLPRERLHVDTWGEDVWVRTISAKDRLVLEEMAATAKGQAAQSLELIVRAVAVCLCDEAGARVFADDDADLEILRTTDARALHQIFAAASRLNGLTPEAQKEAAESFAGRQGNGSLSA